MSSTPNRNFIDKHQITKINSEMNIPIKEYEDCFNLIRIEIQSSVDIVHKNTFHNCYSLKEIKYNHKINSDEDAFSNCYNLNQNKECSNRKIDYQRYDKYYPITKTKKLKFITKEGVLFIPYGKEYLHNFKSYEGKRNFKAKENVPSSNEEERETMYVQYQNQNNIRIVVFPNTIKKICDGKDFYEGVFYHCPNLERVILSNKLQVIGNYAFIECSNLTAIDIPSSVTQIGNWAFADCSNLTTINIPSSVKEIGNNAFEGCLSLTCINIPNSVTQIGYNTFNRCSSLKNLRIHDNCQCLCNFPSECKVERY